MRTERVFGFGFCGDWVEIRKVTPKPRGQGEFFLAFRQKKQRKCLCLLSGITKWGVERLIGLHKEHQWNLTGLVLLVGSKQRDVEMGRAELLPV